MSLSSACRLFGISRQGFYKRRTSALAREEVRKKVKGLVMGVRMEMPRLGTRKLYHLLGDSLRAAGLKVGRDKLFTVLRQEHMLVTPHRRYTKTTHSKHWLRKHPNLAAEMVPSAPEQLWVSDITYVRTHKGFCYLSLVTDAYSRRIMGYHVSDDMGAASVATALKMAVRGKRYDGKLIHHSDRGLQYCSAPYQKILDEHRIRCSMTDGYDCYQNALAERINGILKEEFLFIEAQDLQQLRKMVEQSIRTYNSKRPHLALNMNVPDNIHKQKRSRFLLKTGPVL